jgi:EmrB/QacA subfamily drug resistance transporter
MPGPLTIRPRTAVTVAYVTSLLMASLDTNIVNVMLPTLSREFSAPLTSVKWTVIGYVLALAITMPVAAWLTGRFGIRRVYLFALGLFVLASACCGAAQNLPELVVTRFAQGAAGGLIGPVATAMLYRTYPQNERARLTRLLLMPIALGPALAPPLGGFLVGHLSWRIAFLVNAPVGLLAAVAVLAGLPADHGRRGQRLAPVNFLSAAVGLSGAMYLISEGAEIGWNSPAIIILSCVTLAALGLFVRTEFRSPQPMLDLPLLRDRLFRYSNLATLFQTMTFLGGMLYITPLLLQQVDGRSPLTAGLVMSVVPAGVVTSSQTAGRAFDRIGPRPLVVVGEVLLALDLLAVSRFDQSTPIWAFCATMYFAGVSNGMGMVGLQASMFAHIPRESINGGATLLNVNRQVATALGVSVATVVLTAAGPNGDYTSQPYHLAYLITAASAACAALTGLVIPRRLSLGDPAAEEGTLVPAVAPEPDAA